jgi:hypothetical protein
VNIKQINWLLHFRETVAVRDNTVCGQAAECVNIRTGGTCSTRNTVLYRARIFVRIICSDNMKIKMDLRGTGGIVVDWINLAKDRDQY